MPRTFLALSDAPAAGFTRIPVLEKGHFPNAKYGTIHVDDALFDDMIRNHQKVMGGQVLIDADHQAERTGNRNTAAMGWGGKLEKDGNILYLHTKLTPKGEKVIGNEEYRKTSAVYGDHTDQHGVTHKNVLKGVTLTNRPFLADLPAVSLMTPELELQLAQPDAGTDSNALPDGTYRIDNVPQLKSAIAFAKNGHGDVAAAKPHIARRAKELGRSDLHPWQWGQVPEPAALDGPVSDLDRAMQIALDAAAQLEAPAPGAAPADGSYSLDSSPQALLRDEMACDALVNSLCDSTGGNYADLVVALSSVSDSPTVRHALGRLGQTCGTYVHAKELEAVETGFRELEAHRSQQVRMLEAETQVAADQDEAGRVLLDSGFDVAGYRGDPVAQERDYLRAKQLSSYYAGAGRARWDEDNELYLSSGLSLAKSLERPAQRETVRMALAAPPAASSATVRTLDRAEPVKFVSLSAEAMLLALSEWEARGRDKVTLDQCAAIVSGHELSSVDGERDGDDVIPTIGSTNPGIGGLGDGHHELDQRIREHQADHGCGDYHCGLAAVTGISLGNGIAGTP